MPCTLECVNRNSFWDIVYAASSLPTLPANGIHGAQCALHVKATAMLDEVATCQKVGYDPTFFSCFRCEVFNKYGTSSCSRRWSKPRMCWEIFNKYHTSSCSWRRVIYVESSAFQACEARGVLAYVLTCGHFVEHPVLFTWIANRAPCIQDVDFLRFPLAPSAIMPRIHTALKKEKTKVLLSKYMFVSLYLYLQFFFFSFHVTLPYNCCRCCRDVVFTASNLPLIAEDMP